MGTPTTNYRNEEQNRIAYLNLIQGNIARMSGNSALMKGFAATMIAAMLGMVVSDSVRWYYIAILIFPIIAFIRLDIFYLQMERRYRNLYDIVTKDKDRELELDYTLDLKSSKLEERKEDVYENSSFFKTLCSVSVWQFYIWFIVLMVALVIFVA